MKKEITLEELLKEGFTYKQIYTWVNAGILCQPTKIENKGGRKGRITYYPVENLHRLQAFKKYPLKSLLKGYGLNSLFHILYIEGFYFDGLFEKEREIIQQSCNLSYKKIKEKLKTVKKNHPIADKDAEMEDLYNKIQDEYIPPDKRIPFNIDPNLLKPFVYRLLGNSKNNTKKMLAANKGKKKMHLNRFLSQINDDKIQKLLPKEIQNGFININSFPLNMIKDAIEEKEVKEAVDTGVNNYIVNILPIKELVNQALSISDKDLWALQALLQLPFISILKSFVYRPESASTLLFINIARKTPVPLENSNSEKNLTKREGKFIPARDYVEQILSEAFNG